MRASTHRSSGRRLIPVALLATASLALAACGGGAGAQAPAGSPTSGGKATIAVASDAGCVDPQQVASNDTIWSTRQIVDSLTDQNPKTGEIVPWLAESWDISPDSTAFTFHLRKGATFSDGSAVDAAAVKVNLDRAVTLGARAGLIRGYLSGYAASTVVDPQTVTVSFKQPNAQFLQATSTHSLGLLSPASVPLSDDERCKGVIGSGPFVLGSYTPNQSVVLTKRAGYSWGSSLWKHKGAAYLDQVTFQVVPESGVRAGSLQSGESDVISSIGPQDEAAFKGTNVVLQARSNPGVVFNLGFNHQRPLGADPVVRKALSLALDRQQIVDTVYTSQTKPATSILASTTPMYAEQKKALGSDPKEAGKLLKDAGWVRGSDGIYAKDGRKLSLTVSWSAVIGTNKPALELIQQQAAASGIDLQLKELQVAESASVLASGDFDIYWSNLTRADPDILRSSYSTALANNYRLPASDLDAALAAQAADSDPVKRAGAAAQAQQLIVDSYDVVPVVELTTVLAHSPKIHDVTYDASSRIQLFDTWTTGG
ncbi:ABC transporter substrate-binding protein [Cumulibacter manganitolerans]|uniref:ABC transporter substrate-binding protein n=1 Tax=Cumulibacter manganitolerans TaxID=1884992 RepID=UPI001E626226|nr:ABC transporter substrate-binding protein [Cumulibacter manganitolerans]